MDDKYYVPEITDLFPGYECETQRSVYGEYDDIKEPKEVHWGKHVFGVKNTTFEFKGKNGTIESHTVYDIMDTAGYFRTPYLTQEQIEAEGWTFKQTNKIRYWYERKDTFIECPMTTGYQYMALELMHDPDPEYRAITISAHHRGEGGFEIIYKGFCPSINEFRKIIKLLGI